MSSGSSFGQTLQFITSVKLQELEKQRLAYQAHAQVLQDAAATTDDIARVEILAKAVQSWAGSGKVGDTKIVGGKLGLHNLGFWLQQAERDPSFDRSIIRGWEQTLEKHIKHTTMRFDCARLFGNLFNEWVASGDSSTVAYQSPVDDDVGKAEEFVEIPRKGMYEQKEQLSSIVFDEKPVDTAALLKYLQELFSSDDGKTALAKLRKELAEYGVTLQQRTLGGNDVVLLIKGLLASGLMDEEKRATIKEFMDNPTVLDEVASVLNMRLTSLDTWSWPAEGIVVEMRRHLNGKYRAFTDPEIVDALFLQHLGISWQVKFKSAFLNLFDSKAWKRSPPPSPKEKERRELQLRTLSSTPPIDQQKNTMRRDNFFMTQLANSEDSNKAYDDLLDAPENGDSKEITPVAVKQKLLHIMTTECYLNQAIYEEYAVIRSDLEWFGPSLPHTSILCILQFLGIEDIWLNLFKEFLSAPLRFKGESESQVRVRKRGTPIAYALSALFGEVVLFGMDFAVNQKAAGLFLYRMHDDLWLWDADPDICLRAWGEMNFYADLVGVAFNKRKTGSAYIGNSDVVRSSLPPGDIRWGFLQFNTAQACFVIDQADVDLHIEELRRQLSATKSVFGWVNVYNKYMAFFLRNFGGRPARCFGMTHRSHIVDTIGRIQRKLFPDTEHGPTEYLRTVIKTRFGIQNLPEGYFYFPIGSGGLELRNPLLELFALEKDELTSGSDVFKLQLELDEGDYNDSRERWNLLSPSSKCLWRDGFAYFMTLDEYKTLRESTLPRWGTLYDSMLKIPTALPMTLTPALRAAMEGADLWWNSQALTKTDRTTDRGTSLLRDGSSFRGLRGRGRGLYMGSRLLHGRTPVIDTTGTLPPNEPAAWSSLDWYEKWVVSMYGEGVVETFGGLQVVDPTLIPIGMVQLFRSSRIKLDQ